MYSTKLEIPCYPAELPRLIRLELNSCYVGPVPAAQLIYEGHGTAWFELGDQTFEIRTKDPRAVLGDVVLVNPARGAGERLIRRNSEHNTLLITERCDQLCVMCSQPPKNYELDLFESYEAALHYAPRDAVIGISGGEPLLYKDRLFDLLAKVHVTRPDLAFHILSNGQHLQESDLDRLSALPLHQIRFAVPLYSSQPDVHDQIVAKQGAWHKALEGIAILMEAGADVEIRTVLMQPNVHDLPQLAQFLAWNLPDIGHWAVMQMEYIGFARKNWTELFYDHSLDLGPLRAAAIIAIQHGLALQLYNMPLCTLDDALRPLAPRTISDWKQKYFSDCTDCRLKEACSGFFAWASPAQGFATFGPLVIPPQE